MKTWPALFRHRRLPDGLRRLLSNGHGRPLPGRRGRLLPALLLSVLVPLLLCGCADEAASQAAKESPMKAKTWSTAVTLQDEWTPEAGEGAGEVGDVSSAGLTLPASEAAPVMVVLEEKKDSLDGYTSYEGGVGAEYAFASLADAPETSVEDPEASVEDPETSGHPQTAHAVIGAALEELNAQVEDHVRRELAEGPDRHTAYQAAKKETTYIYLTSWVSPQIARCDTQMLSYVLETYRYDRGFETDYYEVHGVTIDAQDGRRLTLTDIFTDLEPLPALVWDALEINRRSGAARSQREAEIELLRAAMEGGRDDGSFAWMVYPEGLEFRIVLRTAGQPGSADERHQEFSAFLPFSLCREILREQLDTVPYDYLNWYSRTDVKRILGAEVPTGMGSNPGTGSGRLEPAEAPHKPYTCYLGQVNGQTYLYGCDEEYTDAYRVETSEAADDSQTPAASFTLVGSTQGEFYMVRSHNAYTMPDVGALDLRCTMETIQELFLDGSARLGEGGLPVMNGLFRIRNSQPIMGNGEGFEAELFADDDATESSLGTIAPYASLDLCRTDGETFLDAYVRDDALPEDTICRLYIGGSEEAGWTVNGRPMEEVFGHMGYWEE